MWRSPEEEVPQIAGWLYIMEKPSNKWIRTGGWYPHGLTTSTLALVNSRYMTSLEMVGMGVTKCSNSRTSRGCEHFESARLVQLVKPSYFFCDIAGLNSTGCTTYSMRLVLSQKWWVLIIWPKASVEKCRSTVMFWSALFSDKPDSVLLDMKSYKMDVDTER